MQHICVNVTSSFGVGKSLSVRLEDDLADRFPDGAVGASGHAHSGHAHLQPLALSPAFLIFLSPF